jgi:DNA polymerase-3 subunit epsilon
MLVLNKLFQHYEIKPKPMQFICTVSLSRAIWGRQQRYSLGPLCQRLGIPITHHHAGSDAEGTGYVLLKQMADAGHTDINEMSAALGYGLGSVSEAEYRGFKRIR